MFVRLLQLKSNMYDSSTIKWTYFVISVDPKVLTAADIHELDNMEEAGFVEVVHMLDVRAKVPYALVRQVMVFHGLVPYPQKVLNCQKVVNSFTSVGHIIICTPDVFLCFSEP